MRSTPVEETMTDPAETPLLSIIIPAYNEAQRLPESLRQIDAFIAAQSYRVEVIVVNNDSSDATPRIAEDFARTHSYVRVLDEQTRGKGAAVRTGIHEGRGDYLFICDADFSMPVAEINKFLPPRLNGYDVAIASREVAGAQRIDEPAYRHFMGRVFNLVVRLLAIPRIQDTQCGFKSFRRDTARDIFLHQTINGWGFDVELLFVALKHGYRVVEVPITWYYRPQSRISPFKDSVRMVIDVLHVRWNGLRGVYRQK
jgi:glycosyltransferase involved in cell wall biosynthesis